MRNLMLSLCLFLGSCCILGPECYVYEWEHDIKVDNLNEAMEWCSKKIEYKDDKENYWQTPKETYFLRTGDCEDFCILFMQLAYELGYNPELVVIKTKSKSQHAIVKIDNNYYDIQPNKKYKSIEKVDNFKELWESFSYNETMYYAVTYHRSPVY